MTAVLSKRQQARNERALQELIKTVPGNERCADCQAKNPGWAGWSLGIFLCMRCAALHRKLGTHISKVKSLSMDSWANDQVENMRRTGNTVSNRMLNPHNVSPNMPLDIDEVDSAMERFIRQKYEHRALLNGAVRTSVRHNTGSTDSEDPPPLPPKPTKRFGFTTRSASANFPVRQASRGDYNTSPQSPTTRHNGDSHQPTLRNKQSRVFGASVGATGESFESKLATLKEMGFHDDKRNASVLKGMNGSLERSIETLVRLGDGGGVDPRSRRAGPPPRESSRSRSVAIERSESFNPTSTNPFDQPSRPQHQSQQPSQPYPVSNDAMNDPQRNLSVPNQYHQQPLEQSFQNLQIAQPLFPNATGGFPLQQPHIPYQQPLTPLVPSMIPQQHGAFTNPFQQHQSLSQSRQGSIEGGYNPFGMQGPAQRAFSASYLPPTQQQPHQLQTQYNYDAQDLAPQTYASQQSSPQRTLPPQQQFVHQPPFQQQYIQDPTQYQPSPYQTQQPLVAQPTGRADKSTILALYNYPHLAPAAPATSQNLSSSNAPPTDPSLIPTAESSLAPLSNPLQTQSRAQGLGQRSVSTPAGPSSGSRNPFLSAPHPTNSTTPITSFPLSATAAATTTKPAQPIRHTSQESVDMGGWLSGRHSPDAFASLSARSGR
ncbi:MAG: hypothetical protein M1817_003593 [Caeruleum heppii]|nr:MAG: hypothetical protein M1817_003593 [Caeruleum heppii]